MKYWILLFLSFALVCSSCSDDDPTTITEIVTVHDTVTVVQHDTSIIIQTDTIVFVERDTVVQILPEDSSIVIVCVRHAETAGGGSNPSLSTDGQSRADDLAHLLSNLALSQVYSTDFNRTRQTAMPTAMDQGLNVTTYNAFNIPSFAQDLKTQHKGQVVLAVGHSNTTPDLINHLTGTTNIPQFNENTYDNLYIVRIRLNGTSIVYHLEYGENTP